MSGPVHAISEERLVTATLLRLPFDQYGRYRLISTIVDAARPHLGAPLRILDVGGLAVTRRGETILPAQLFLPADTVTVLDRPACDLPGYVQGDGRGIAFDNAAFDLVISCDTLEHIPAPDRAAFWRELLRVTRHGVILAAPFASPETVAAEALLQRYIQAELGVTQPQLAEHSAYGLPDRGLTAALLHDLGCAHRVYPGGNVHAWLAMMLAKHTRIFGDPDLHDQLDSYYNRFLAAGERYEPAYRLIWVVAADPAAPWLPAVDAAIAPGATAAPNTDWRDLATLISQTQTLRLVGEHFQAHSAQSALVQELTAGLARRDAQIADLEQRAAWFESQAQAARSELEAVKQGRLMRLLRLLRR